MGIDHERMRKRKREAIEAKRISRNKQANQAYVAEQGSSSWMTPVDRDSLLASLHNSTSGDGAMLKG